MRERICSKNGQARKRVLGGEYACRGMGGGSEEELYLIQDKGRRLPASRGPGLCTKEEKRKENHNHPSGDMGMH